MKTGDDVLTEFGTRSCDKRCKTWFQKLGTTNSVVDVMDHAVISSINWFVYLSFKLGRQPYKLTRVLNNALTDIDFKPKCKLVPFLGDVGNVLYIKIYHHWSHPASGRLQHNINSLQDDATT